MHIEGNGDRLLIPNFAVDSVSSYQQGVLSKLQITTILDAPSGISMLNGLIAIADFYHHRIVLIKKDSTIIIGNKGHSDGMLNYPTDVKLYQDKVLVLLQISKKG